MFKLVYKIRSGFSLFEIAIVLTVIAVLISCVVSGKVLLDGAKMNLMYSEINSIKLALIAFINDNNITENSIYKKDLYGTYNIGILDLANSGYIKKDKVIGDAYTPYYQSKIGGYWYLTTSEKGEKVPALILTSSMDSYSESISTTLCNKFLNKFSIKDVEDTTEIQDIGYIKGSCINSNGKSYLIINIYNLFE